MYRLAKRNLFSITVDVVISATFFKDTISRWSDPFLCAPLRKKGSSWRMKLRQSRPVAFPHHFSLFMLSSTHHAHVYQPTTRWCTLTLLIKSSRKNVQSWVQNRPLRSWCWAFAFAFAFFLSATRSPLWNNLSFRDYDLLFLYIHRVFKKKKLVKWLRLLLLHVDSCFHTWTLIRSHNQNCSVLSTLPSIMNPRC